MDEIAVGALSDMADGDYRIFAVETVEVGVFRLGDRVVAYENTCPHAGGPASLRTIFNRVEELRTPEKKSLGLRFSNRGHVVRRSHGYDADSETGRQPGDPAVLQ